MAAQAEISIKDKVDQLMSHTEWSPLNDSRPDGVLSGIYAIGEEVISERRGSKVNTVLYRYLGHSEDIGQRLPHHLKKSGAKEGRKISKFIQDRKQEGLEETLMVKWIEENNQESLEGEYLEKLEDQLGYELKYNIQRGDGINRESDEKTSSQIHDLKQPPITKYFKVKKTTTIQIERESEKAGKELGHQLEDKINRNPNSQIPAKCSQSDMNETKVIAETVESISSTQLTTQTEMSVKDKVDQLRNDIELSALQTRGPDGDHSDEKAEKSGEISEKGGAELNRKRRLGGEAETNEDVPPEGAPPPSKLRKMQTESKVQGPSHSSACSTNLEPPLCKTQSKSEIVPETQSSVLDKTAKEKKKRNKRREYKSTATVPPSPIESSVNIFKKNATKNQYVFFSLKIDTTLRRIVAVHDEDQLDIDVLTSGEDFSPGKEYNFLEAIALDRFINFLKKIHKPVLVGHNTEAFQCPELCRVLNLHDLWKEFTSVVQLFVDTLAIFKEEYPDQTQLKINDLRKIVQGENASPVEDDLLEEVKALRELSLFERKDNGKIKDKFLQHESLMRPKTKGRS